MTSATTKGTNPDCKGVSGNPTQKYTCTVNDLQNQHTPIKISNLHLYEQNVTEMIHDRIKGDLWSNSSTDS